MTIEDQGRTHAESARRAMESARPPSMQQIERIATQRIQRRKVRTAVLAGGAAIALSSVALFFGPLGDTAAPPDSASTLPTTSVGVPGVTAQPTTVTSTAELPPNQLPYLGLDLEGWEFVRAAEAEATCVESPDQPPQLTSRQATYATRTAAGSDLRMVNINLQPGSAQCGEEVPADAAELGPPADPPHVNDHGIITVMGHPARVVDEEGIFRVLWLLDEQGSVASLDIFPGEVPLTVSDVIAIAEGIVELTPEEWTALLEVSPDAPNDTVP